VESFERALAIAREIGDRRGQGDALHNLGVAYAMMGDPGRAAEYQQRRLTAVRESGDKFAEAASLWNPGLAYEQGGDLGRDTAVARLQSDAGRSVIDTHGGRDSVAPPIAASRHPDVTAPLTSK
jgi:tetratricopeptide (TPR) repeat protein